MLAKELYPGNFKPTPAHYFIRLLEKKGLLLRCFTQNIDSLEREAGVSSDKIVAAHGNFDGEPLGDIAIPCLNASLSRALDCHVSLCAQDAGTQILRCLNLLMWYFGAQLVPSDVVLLQICDIRSMLLLGMNELV